MNLNEKFMSEWREDAEMSDDYLMMHAKYLYYTVNG